MLILDSNTNDMTFKHFLTESSNVRIEHVEDKIFSAGYEGAVDAIEFLRGVKDSFESHVDSSINVTVKWDGCVDPQTIITTLEHGDITIDHAIDCLSENQTLHIQQWDFEQNDICFQPVDTGWKQQGSKDWVEVCCENDHIIRLTYDHEVYTTNRGWVQAGNLKEGDNILSC